MSAFKIVLASVTLFAANPVLAQSFEHDLDGSSSGARSFTNVSSENAQSRYKAQVFYPIEGQVRRVETLRMR